MPDTTMPTFGELPEDERPDLTPIPFQIVGYDAEGEPSSFTFHARASVPMGSMMKMIRGVDAKGDMDTAAIMQFLNEVLIADDRDRWTTTLDRDDLAFSATMLGDLGEWLGEHYMNRPTPPRSARRRGSRPTRTTSGAGSRVSAGLTSG